MFFTLYELIGGLNRGVSLQGGMQLDIDGQGAKHSSTKNASTKLKQKEQAPGKAQRKMLQVKQFQTHATKEIVEQHQRNATIARELSLFQEEQQKTGKQIPKGTTIDGYVFVLCKVSKKCTEKNVLLLFFCLFVLCRHVVASAQTVCKN